MCNIWRSSIKRNNDFITRQVYAVLLNIYIICWLITCIITNIIVTFTFTVCKVKWCNSAKHYFLDYFYITEHTHTHTSYQITSSYLSELIPSQTNVKREMLINTNEKTKLVSVLKATTGNRRGNKHKGTKKWKRCSEKDEDEKEVPEEK